MLSSGYAHEHNEEGEPMMEEIYIPWLVVLTFTLGTLIRVLLGT